MNDYEIVQRHDDIGGGWEVYALHPSGQFPYRSYLMVNGEWESPYSSGCVPLSDYVFKTKEEAELALMRSLLEQE